VLCNAVPVMFSLSPLNREQFLQWVGHSNETVHGRTRARTTIQEEESIFMQKEMRRCRFKVNDTFQIEL
jgi:hypothetical protein